MRFPVFAMPLLSVPFLACTGTQRAAAVRDPGPGIGTPITTPADDGCGAASVCESFERYPVGTLPVGETRDTLWRIEDLDPDMLAIDDSRSFSGTRSVHVQVPATRGGHATALLSLNRNDVLPAPVLHARLMFFFDGTPQGASPFHWSFMQMEGAFTPTTEIVRSRATFGIGGWHKSTRGGLQNVMAAHGPDGFMDCWNHAAMAVPTGRWVCIEWTLDSTHHTQRVTLDGRPAPELSFSGVPTASNGCLKFPPEISWYVPPIDRFSFGYVQWHASDHPRNLWIDDVVVSTTPIGCPASR